MSATAFQRLRREALQEVEAVETETTEVEAVETETTEVEAVETETTEEVDSETPVRGGRRGAK